MMEGIHVYNHLLLFIMRQLTYFCSYSYIIVWIRLCSYYLCRNMFELKCPILAYRSLKA